MTADNYWPAFRTGEFFTQPSKFTGLLGRDWRNGATTPVNRVALVNEPAGPAVSVAVPRLDLLRAENCRHAVCRTLLVGCHAVWHTSLPLLQRQACCEAAQVFDDRAPRWLPFEVCPVTI